MTSIQRKDICLMCGDEFAYRVERSSARRRTVCDTQACKAAVRRANLPNRGRDDPYQPALVDRMLDESVAMECAPAWMRHPVPWDHVVYRRAGT